jgi:glycosyltransferase involved in cell wall biosynthesis
MPNVLHLLGPGADEQTRRLHEMLTSQIGAEFESITRTIGPAGSFRNLPTAGVRLRGQGADVICVWGLTALAAAIIAGHRRMLFCPDRFMGPRSLRWARSLMALGDVHMICPTAGQQRLAVQRGIPFDRCHVIRPGVDFGRLKRKNPELRRQLGLADTDFVVLAPGESTVATAHELAMWAIGILHVLDPAYKLVVWGRGTHAGPSAGLSRQLRKQQMLKFAQPLLGRSVDYEDLLAIADMCLITAGSAVPTLPIITTMAAGVPIVSTVTFLLAELLEDRHTALMVPQRSPRALAQRVLDLRGDPSLRWKIADTARAEAYEFFPMTRMLDQYRRVYRQMIGAKPINADEDSFAPVLR